jgi:hypothetical protein
MDDIVKVVLLILPGIFLAWAAGNLEEFWDEERKARRQVAWVIVGLTAVFYFWMGTGPAFSAK